MDKVIVPGNHGTEFRIPKLSRNQNQKIVKCEVNNEIGKSEETETLDINCEYPDQTRAKTHIQKTFE